MKTKFTFLFFGIFLFFNTYGQLPYGAHAENWTLDQVPAGCDVSGGWGPTWDFYSDVLDQGYNAVIDFSAVWCGPCWSYHNTGTLETLWNNHGPNGDNTIRVFYIEADCSTNVECLCGSSGCNGSTQGNWMASASFPFFSPSGSDCSTVTSDYAIAYYPTLYAINAEYKTVWEVGQASVAGWESWLYESFTLEATSTVEDDLCGTNEGYIELTVSGGHGSLDYLWNTGAETQNIYDLTPGMYSVTITDANGYFIMLNNIEVDGNSDPLVVEQNNIEDNLCFGDSDGSIDLNVSGGYPEYTYLWSNGDTDEDIYNLAAGEYTVTVTDDIGCEKVQTYYVSEPEELVLTGDSFEATCNEDNGSIILYSDGGVPPYLYSIGGDYYSSSDFYDLAPGWYTASIIDYNECYTETPIFVDEIPGPISDAGPSAELTCDVTTVQLDGTGSSTGSQFTYHWTTEDGNIVEGETTLTPTVDAQGAYVLEVTESNNNCISYDTTFVTEDENIPLATVASPDDITCSTSTVTLDGSASSSGANYSYFWTTDDGNIVSGENTNMAVVDAGGTYTLSVTNTDNGCVATFSQTVVEDVDPPAFSTEGTTLTCSAPISEICVIVTSPFDSVVWTGNGYNDTCLTVNEAGDYGFTVYGTNGCVSSGSVTAVDQTTLPTINIATPQSLGCGVTTVNLDASASSSGAEYSYSWTTSNGHFVSSTNGSIATVDKAGLYSLTINNTLTGCISTDTVEVFDGAQVPDATFTYTVDYNTATLYGITITGAYTSTWEDGTTTIMGDTVVFSFNDNGDYEICHYQENNCGIDTSCSVISITAILPLSYSENIKNISCNGESDGSISVVGSGGVGALSIAWTGPNNFSSSEFDIADLGAGTYAMTMTDEGNHSISGEFTITEPEPISIQYTITNATSSSNDGSIDITVTGGTPPYTFSWSNGSSEEDPKDLAKGDYTVVITDANNCTYTETFSVGATGVNDPEFVEKFEIYPNPVLNQTRINLVFQEYVKGNLKLIDFSGKLIKEFNVKGQNSIIKLEMSDMKSGIYILKLESNNKVAIRKLIKL